MKEYTFTVTAGEFYLIAVACGSACNKSYDAALQAKYMADYEIFMKFGDKYQDLITKFSKVLEDATNEDPEVFSK